MKCEICGYIGHTEKHHIQSKSLGGNNSKANLTNLCPNCHAEVHHGEIILEGKFMTTLGPTLFYHKKNESPILPLNEFPKVFLF
jgi:5-methylcytosine-specific restriction endonuclease McrA